MSNGNGIAATFNVKSVMSAVSWIIQAALIGLVSLLATWVSNQNAVNTQTAIALSQVQSKLENAGEAFKDMRAKFEKADERMRQLELQIAQGRVPK